jgi:hypothetical protein
MLQILSAVWRQYIQLKKEQWGWVPPKLVCWKRAETESLCVLIQSIQVNLRGVGACYLRGFGLVLARLLLAGREAEGSNPLTPAIYLSNTDNRLL